MAEGTGGPGLKSSQSELAPPPKPPVSGIVKFEKIGPKRSISGIHYQIPVVNRAVDLHNC